MNYYLKESSKIFLLKYLKCTKLPFLLLFLQNQEKKHFKAKKSTKKQLVKKKGQKSTCAFQKHCVRALELHISLPLALSSTQIEPKKSKWSKFNPHFHDKTGVHMVPALAACTWFVSIASVSLAQFSTTVQPPHITWKVHALWPISVLLCQAQVHDAIMLIGQDANLSPTHGGPDRQITKRHPLTFWESSLGVPAKKNVLHLHSDLHLWHWVYFHQELSLDLDHCEEVQFSSLNTSTLPIIAQNKMSNHPNINKVDPNSPLSKLSTSRSRIFQNCMCHNRCKRRHNLCVGRVNVQQQHILISTLRRSSVNWPPRDL